MKHDAESEPKSSTITAKLIKSSITEIFLCR